MLSEVRIVSPFGEVLRLPLGDISNGYSVQEIEGLDPVKATIALSKFAMLDGARYLSSKLESRNIVFKIGLHEDGYSLTADLRAKLYDYFMPKTIVRMTFVDDMGGEASITGIVETMDAALFTDEPLMQASIICPDPLFVASVPSKAIGVTGSQQDADVVEINYKGTSPAPVFLSIQASGALTSVQATIEHFDTQSRFSISGFTTVAGSRIDITTEVGNKSAFVYAPDGSSLNFLRGVSPASNWLELYPGINKLRVITDGTASSYSLQYNERFGGL